MQAPRDPRKIPHLFLSQRSLAPAGGAPMSLLASIFQELNLPNAATWFYFSVLLAVALCFKFSRLLSLRNCDVLVLFLFVPGLLLFLLAIEQRQMPPETATTTAQ